MQQFYTLVTLAARLNRSVVGVRTRLLPAKKIPQPKRGKTLGRPMLWSVAVIEKAILKNPALVLKAKGGVQ